MATITPVWGQNPHELWVACQGRARRPASSRYGERLLTDPDDRLCNPLLGEPAANVGEELGDLRWRRRAPVVEIPDTVALLADSAALAPQSLGEQKTAAGARTSFYSAELKSLYVAVPHRGGQKAEIRMRTPDPSGRRRFVGVLRGAGAGQVSMELEGRTVALALDDVDRAKLIPDL